ncbi:MAG: glycosyltransferase family 4 protein, partial [Verrucomicrobia bacterium]|nr:glycosyltransferase family 4 protein [Verrucomicrobiota bacterium]
APSNTIKIIGVGSVIGWKKWDLVVEAIRRLDPALQKRIEFNIWGPTLQFPEAIAFADRLKKSIKQHHLTSVVHLRGSTTDVVGELHNSDLFILPSTNEPCSVALMEALALGLPVIVSESGGSVDIIKKGCGLHFKVDDPDSLKASLERAIDAPDQFRLPEEIRETVRERCATRVFGLYQTLYKDITS